MIEPGLARRSVITQVPRGPLGAPLDARATTLAPHGYAPDRIRRGCVPAIRVGRGGASTALPVPTWMRRSASARSGPCPLLPAWPARLATAGAARPLPPPVPHRSRQRPHGSGAMRRTWRPSGGCAPPPHRLSETRHPLPGGHLRRRPRAVAPRAGPSAHRRCPTGGGDATRRGAAAAPGGPPLAAPRPGVPWGGGPGRGSRGADPTPVDACHAPRRLTVEAVARALTPGTSGRPKARRHHARRLRLARFGVRAPAVAARCGADLHGYEGGVRLPRANPPTSPSSPASRRAATPSPPIARLDGRPRPVGPSCWTAAPRCDPCPRPRPSVGWPPAP